MFILSLSVVSVAWRCLAALCAVGLTVDDRLTLQRYSASHGVVNDLSVCCTNLRGLCANHRFCGAQSHRLVLGRACTSYLCPLRASRVLQRKMRVRTWPSRWLPPAPAIFIAAFRGYSSSTSKALNFLKSTTLPDPSVFLAILDCKYLN